MSKSKQPIHSHTYIYKNGYKVCIKCGKTCNELHIRDDISLHELRGERKRIMNENYPTRSHTRKDTQKWRRLRKVQTRYVDSKYTQHPHRTTRITAILNAVGNYLNEKQILQIKQELYNEYDVSTIRNINKSIYTIIQKHDYPIETRELRKIILSFSTNQYFKINRDMKNLEQIRTYYWLIDKIITKLPNFTNAEKMRLYKKIYNYYRLIRFRLCKSFNPTLLIKSLAYIIVKSTYRQRKQTKVFFEIDNQPLLPLKKILRHIRENNLDTEMDDQIDLTLI